MNSPADLNPVVSAAARPLNAGRRRLGPWLPMLALTWACSPGSGVAAPDFMAQGGTLLAQPGVPRLRPVVQGREDYGSADEHMIFQSKVARSMGLQGMFEAARRHLNDKREMRSRASDLGKAHWWLEWGRTWCSATHPAAAMDAAARQQASEAFAKAEQLATAVEADDVAVDALHMMAFVETDPASAQRWTEKALARALASSQPAARRWEGSLRNNLGVALMDQGQPAPALVQFEAALAARRAAGAKDDQRRIAEWMVAWALRVLKRHDEALAIQERLAQENDAAKTPDPEVFDEIALLQQARGQDDAAQQARARAAALRKTPAR